MISNTTRQVSDTDLDELWPHVLAAMDPQQRAWAAPAAGDPQLARLALPTAPSAVRGARGFLRDVLAAWAMRELSDDAAIVVSELVTNALQHGSSPDGGAAPIDLILSGRDNRLMTVVTNPGHHQPTVTRPGLAAETGRGLLIVEMLSDAWGWARLPRHQTVVWAVFHPLR